MGVETSLILMLKALLLLVTANGAPVLVSAFAGQRVAEPIDGSFKFGDGRPLFGASKTWLGLFVSLTATIAVAFGLGYSLITGALFASASMVGDLLASFCKRRLGWAEGSHVRGLVRPHFPVTLGKLLDFPGVFVGTSRGLFAGRIPRLRRCAAVRRNSRKIICNGIDRHISTLNPERNAPNRYFGIIVGHFIKKITQAFIIFLQNLLNKWR